MWGMVQDPGVAWTPGKVRPSQATAQAQQGAPNYGSGLVHRLEVALREGRIHVAGMIGFQDADWTPGEGGAWYMKGPQP